MSKKLKQGKERFKCPKCGHEISIGFNRIKKDNLFTCNFCRYKIYKDDVLPIAIIQELDY